MGGSGGGGGGLQCDASGGEGNRSETGPPSLLADVAGCIAPVPEAARGGSWVQLADERGGGDAREWATLWVRVSCKPLAQHWPLGVSVHGWGVEQGAASWLLAPGAAEGGGGERDLHVPPRTGDAWRPLGLVRGGEVGLFTRDGACSALHAYKGTRHPFSAPLCEWAAEATEAATATVAETALRPAAGWYGLPGGDEAWRDAATARWLASFAFSSSGALAMLIKSDSPLRTPDAMRVSAVDCLLSTCAEPFGHCAVEEECRTGWDEFAAAFGEPPWNGTRLRGWAAGSVPPLRALIDCFAERCTCQAHDALPHLQLYRGALSDVELAAVSELARAVGHTSRRTFGETALAPDRPLRLVGGGDERGGSGEVSGGDEGGGDEPRGHNVTYLGSRLVTELPALYEKLLGLAMRADEESGWRLLRRGNVTVRTAELLEYAEANDALGWHYDEQSAVTALVMFSDAADFEGAALQHEVGGEVRTMQPRRGDVAFYRSHQPHRVTQLRGGRRVAMAVEWWHVAEGEFSSLWSRPSLKWGTCPR